MLTSRATLNRIDQDFDDFFLVIISTYSKPPHTPSGRNIEIIHRWPICGLNVLMLTELRPSGWHGNPKVLAHTWLVTSSLPHLPGDPPCTIRLPSPLSGYPINPSLYHSIIVLHHVDSNNYPPKVHFLPSSSLLANHIAELGHQEGPLI